MVVMQIPLSSGNAAYQSPGVQKSDSQLTSLQNTCKENVSACQRGLCKQGQDTWVSAGEQIGLQAGCLTVLTRAQQAGVPTHVVSVNYSSEMVKAALQRGSLNIVTA